MIYEDVIKPFLSEKRFKHCLNVARAAEKLAKQYGADPEKAKVAGVLHDITKEWTVQQHLKFAEEFGIELTEFEFSSEKLFHAMTGSAYARHILEINDDDILNAIRYHTTGRAGMSLLEKVVFIADFISDDRDYKGVDEIRKWAYRGLDKVMMEGLAYTVKDLSKSHKPIHPNTFGAYNEIALKRVKGEKVVKASELCSKVCEILENKKAIEVNYSCVKDVSVLADYFIYATGTSNTHVKSLAEEVELKLKEKGIYLDRREADKYGTWILLDYADVIVHIFTEDARKLYNLEELWDKVRSEPK